MVLITSSLILGSSFVIKGTDNRKKSTFRELTALNRQLDYLSRSKNQTWRLVIDMDETQNSWWVEKKLSHNTSSDQAFSSANQSFPTGNFVIDTNFFAKPQKLPGKMTFESVELSGKENEITKGKAYIHYFPEGQFNMAVLKVKRNNTYWSLFINRLHGELTVFTGNKSLKDLRNKF